MLFGKGLYGVNPVEVDTEGDILRVHTELPGGLAAAKKCFENLTGREPIGAKDNFRMLDGTFVNFRASGKSGHPKVEINAESTTKVHEKITFK